MALQFGAASLVGILLECTFYGIYFVLFAYNLYLQLRNSGERAANGNRPNPLLLGASILLFAMITTHWSLGVARLYEATITLAKVESMNQYFGSIQYPKHVATVGLLELEVLIGDSILIYRLYHVYQPRWWVCVLPAVASLAFLVSIGFLMYSMSRFTPAGEIFVSKIAQVQPWINTSFSLTLFINVYCTLLIVFRLWRSQVAVGKAADSNIVRVLRIFVESAAILTICVFCTFVTFEVGSVAEYAFLEFSSPILGIAFTLILLRLNWARSIVVGSSQPGSGYARSQLTYALRPVNGSMSADSTYETDHAKKGPSVV